MLIIIINITLLMCRDCNTVGYPLCVCAWLCSHEACSADKSARPLKCMNKKCLRCNNHQNNLLLFGHTHYPILPQKVMQIGV